MIVVLEIVLWLSVIIAACIGLYQIGKGWIPSLRHRKTVRPAQARNKTKEQTFIANLLEDIRINTDEWFLMENVGMGSIIANDHKNIGIVYSSTGENATIILNLDNLNKFDKQNEDTVKISVYGEHIKKFLISAEDLIDRRGHEIAFFQDELEKRL